MVHEQDRATHLIEQSEIDTGADPASPAGPSETKRCPGSNPPQRSGLVGHLAPVMRHHASREVVHHNARIMTYHRHF